MKKIFLSFVFARQYTRFFTLYRMCNDQITAERNKIRGDLNEANNRILILIKEGDERYNSMERSKDREIE